jgi:restriction system protein
MARKRSSAIEDLMDISSKLPWQGGVGLALVTYIFMHILAGFPVSNGTGVNVWAIFAGIFQYLIPFVLLVGAFVSFILRKRQSELHGRVVADPSADALEKMSWREFEGLTAETFRREGYRVVERGGDGPDGGVDLELYMGADKYLVQCKQWRVMKVGVATVRELYGVMTAERAVGGFVVASGSFTNDAESFAEGRAIRLVDARKFRAMIGGVAADKSAMVETTNAVPTCPKCGSDMVRRTAKSGNNAGNQFWGCSQYPGCRGVRT